MKSLGIGILVAAATIAASSVAFADDWSSFDKWRAGRWDPYPLFLHHPVDSTAQDTCTGFLWQGEGNPAITLQRKRNTYAGVELAIKGIVRGGPDLPATYVDSSGVVHIEVPAGTDPNSVITPRAAWNFTYSYNVSLNPANPVLSGYEAFLLVDLDPTVKTKYLPLRLAKLVSYPNLPCASSGDYNGYGWKEGTTIQIPDDEGTEKVTQNSQNLSFGTYLPRIDGNPTLPGIQPYTFTPGQFDVQMFIVKKWDFKTLTNVHVVFDVVTAPSP